MNEDDKNIQLATGLTVAASITARAVGLLAGGDLMGSTVGGQTASRSMVESLAVARIVNQIKAR